MCTRERERERENKTKKGDRLIKCMRSVIKWMKERGHVCTIERASVKIIKR